MIKIDELKVKSELKKKIIPFSIIAILVSIYSILSIMPAIFKIKKKYVYWGYALIIGISLAWISIADYNLAEFIRPYFEYGTYFLHVDPVRLIITSIYGLYVYNYGCLISEGVDDWVVSEKKKQLEQLLPDGKFNFSNRSHMLLFGTSGSGKGVSINHILKHNFEENNHIIMISAKLAHTDNYSQLAYCRKMAQKYNRKLYVVSMDERVEDRFRYNPLAQLDEVELLNALDSMIQVDSHFYHTNFSSWVLCIYDLLKKADVGISFSKILRLYSYSDYFTYVNQLYRKEKITDKERDYFLSERIKTYAETAVNDSANLDLVLRAGRPVLAKTPNKEKISITDALNERAVIYFDLNGNSAASATMLIGSCILAELQHVVKEFSDSHDKKTVICDEASFYISDMLASLFNESRSAGYQMIISTQGPSDFRNSNSATDLYDKITNNANQFGVLRLNGQEDANEAGELVGTNLIPENTRRAKSIDYDGVGSIKATPAMIANPNIIKNLNTCEMIYYQKQNDSDHEPHPVLVKWRTDDL